MLHEHNISLFLTHTFMKVPSNLLQMSDFATMYLGLGRKKFNSL